MPQVKHSGASAPLPLTSSSSSIDEPTCTGFSAFAGTVSTYTPLLGFFGVVGVKSGFTSAAGGCDVLALSRVVHGHRVTVLAAVTGQTGIGQPDVLLAAGKAVKPVWELAAETGLSMNTLLSRKHYAVIYLRERLREIYDELT